MSRDTTRLDILKRTYKYGACLLWAGAKTSAGYGVIRRGGKNHYVHRVILAHKLRRKLARGEQACHTCDTPSCINEAHLFCGTQKDNMKDAHRKGRTNLSGLKLGHGWFKHNPDARMIGTDNRNAKLDNCKVTSIRKLYKQGKSQYELADLFSVSQATIWSVVNRETWQHV